MGTYNHLAAVRYAIKHALAPNRRYHLYSQDCTNFVSQCMLAGGWAMVGGSPWDRKSDEVWWYGKTPFSFVWPASFTWAGAANFARFLMKSRRGMATPEPDLLQPGDVIQIGGSGSISNIFHSMIVTKKESSKLFVSYHTNNRLNVPLAGVFKALPRGEYTYHFWRIYRNYKTRVGHGGGEELAKVADEGGGVDVGIRYRTGRGVPV